MFDDRQQTRDFLIAMLATPTETRMPRLPQDAEDYVPLGPDTTDLWQSSGEDTDEEADSSRIIISHEVLCSFANEAGRYDEECGFVAQPAEKAYSSTGVHSSRRVRFSDAPPSVCRYEKPGIDCYNQLFYTCHELQNMQFEFFKEQAEMMSKSPEGCDDKSREDEDRD
jgi:hypothetical protein